MGRKLAWAKARQWKCQEGGGQQAGVSMKARKEAMGRHSTGGLPAARVRRILPAEKLAEFGTFSVKFHAYLVCG